MRKLLFSAALSLMAVAAMLAVVFEDTSEFTDASSHRESPLILGDPLADATDLYAFVDPVDSTKVTLVANWVPLEEPADGPNFFQFGDYPQYRYGIRIDNDGDAVEDIIYEWRFTTQIQNPNTFLYNTGPITTLDNPATAANETDPDWNIRQVYTVLRTDVDSDTTTVLGSDLPTPPVNIGPKSTPGYEALAAQAVIDLGGGKTTFAGQRDDPFFLDLGSIADLLSLRTPLDSDAGSDTVSGFNTHAIAFRVPAADIVRAGCDPASAADEANGECVIGVWSTTHRPSTTVLKKNGSAQAQGAQIQVSRLGHPLVNEVVIPVGKKDLFNFSEPKDDLQFASFVTDPELAGLLNALYAGILEPVPTGTPGSTDRADLVAVFLTGVNIPGVINLNQPAGVVPSEQLRLNVARTPSECGAPNRLGVLAGDFCGFPNGRRLADDVTDIEIRAVACGYGAVYTVVSAFGPCDADTFAGSINNTSNVGDGVNENEDMPFLSVFPYVGTPHQGFDHAHDHEDSSTGVIPAAMGLMGLILGLAVAAPRVVGRIRRVRA